MQRKERPHPPVPIHSLPSGHVQVLIPNIGDGSRFVTLKRWLVAAGDAVQAEQALCEIEYNEATVEIPVPRAGVVRELLAKEGQTLGVRLPLLTLE